MAEDFVRAVGGCMCGAVRYEADGAPLVVGYCHCHSCRRHNGGPVVTWAAFERDRVRFTKGKRKIFESSPGVGRGFCDRCGTPLTWEGKYGDLWVIDFHISTLDHPEAYVPTVHWHPGERIEWFEVADNLPRLHGDSDDEKPYHHGPVIHGPSG